jgi:hypothetical protein
VGRFACLALFASAVGGAAIAQAPGPGGTHVVSTTATANSSQPPADPVICKSEQEIGSLFTHRVCHTKADWSQITRDAQGFINDTETRAGQATPPGH